MTALKEREAVEAPERGRVSRLRSKAAAGWATFAATVALVIGGGAPAFASTTSTDLTNGAGDTFLTSLKSYFADHVIVIVLSLAAVTIGAGMLLGWGKKGAHQK